MQFQGVTYSRKFCSKCRFPNLVNNKTSQFTGLVIPGRTGGHGPSPRCTHIQTNTHTHTETETQTQTHTHTCFAQQKEKKKRKGKLQSLKAVTIKRMSPRSKCYGFTHSTASIIRNCPCWQTTVADNTLQCPMAPLLWNPFCCWWFMFPKYWIEHQNVK